MTNPLKPNKIGSFVIVLLFLGLVVYGGILSFSNKVGDKPMPMAIGQEGWQKAEFLVTPEGLPTFSFNYASRMSIEDNGGVLEDAEDALGEVSMVRIYNEEDQERVLNGEVEVGSTSADVITLCEISADCFFNLPDVEMNYDDLPVAPLQEVGTEMHGPNEYIIYKDPSFGDLPLTIYAIRFGGNKIFAIHHLGTDNPPSTIDLASVELTFKE